METIWFPVTDPSIRARYHFGSSVESDWTPGSRYELVHASADGPLAEGENLIVDPPHRPVH
jgi:uncharacterized protein YndB with AHSA1/START domain